MALLNVRVANQLYLNEIYFVTPNLRRRGGQLACVPSSAGSIPSKSGDREGYPDRIHTYVFALLPKSRNVILKNRPAIFAAHRLVYNIIE